MEREVRQTYLEANKKIAPALTKRLLDLLRKRIRSAKLVDVILDLIKKDSTHWNGVNDSISTYLEVVILQALIGKEQPLNSKSLLQNHETSIEKTCTLGDHEADLIRACDEGDLNLVKKLYNTGFSLSRNTLEECFLTACKRNHLSLVEYFLDEGDIKPGIREE